MISCHDPHLPLRSAPSRARLFNSRLGHRLHRLGSPQLLRRPDGMAMWLQTRGADMIKWKDAAKFDKKYPDEVNALFHALQQNDLIADDLGLMEMVAIVKAWERVRTLSMVAYLEKIKQ